MAYVPPRHFTPRVCETPVLAVRYPFEYGSLSFIAKTQVTIQVKI